MVTLPHGNSLPLCSIDGVIDTCNKRVGGLGLCVFNLNEPNTTTLVL